MKRLAKALVIARIKENARRKPISWDKPKRGPWDKKKPHKADGGDVLSDEQMGISSTPAVMSDVDVGISAPVEPNAEAPDHGLSERQKLSPVGKALSPITSYPSTYNRMRNDAENQVSEGINQISSAKNLLGNSPRNFFGADVLEDQYKKALEPSAENPSETPETPGIYDVAKGAAKVGLGSLGFVMSPISAAYRSLAGQPIEDTTGIPREYTEFATQLATPGIGLPKLGEVPPTSLPQVSQKSNDVVEAAKRISDVAPDTVNVPRAFASDNIAVQRGGQMARNVPIVGDSIPRATGEMADQLGNAAKSIASEYGEGSGPNVANRIGRNIGDAANEEAASSTNAARTSDDALLADWQRAQDAATDAVNQGETNALQHARQITGDMSPQDTGAALIARLRASEQEARQLKDRLYASAGEGDASVTAGSVQGVHNRISTALDDAGRAIDPQLTPASNRMMEELRNFSQLRIPNRVGAPAPNPADVASVDARGMEQIRKRLSNFSQAANNDADRAAARIIMRQFDDWQADAYDNALFSGSPEALQSFRDARAANANWRQRFYNDRDDADRIINKVVTGEVTPQEMSNWIVGNSQVGSKGVSSRLLTRITDATNGNPDAMNAIRGGIANRLFGSTEGATARNAESVASGINEFFNGSGRDVANRIYTPQQRRVALNYAATLRRAQEARQTIAEAARNTKPSAMEVGPGPMQELATAVLGRGGKTDEALFSAIDAYAKSGARGDIHTLSDILRSIPEKDKGDLAGAIIRNLGQSRTTGDFSLDSFASDWRKYSPQAKSLLFGNAGAHRQALDDIAMISQRYKDVGRRFGNPSGTAQNVTGLGAIAGLFTHPLVAIPSLIGGFTFAKILSSPAGATRVATLQKTAEALAKGRTSARVAALTSAASSLARSTNALGGHITPGSIIRSIQGPVPASASDEQQQPPRAGDQ